MRLVTNLFRCLLLGYLVLLFFLATKSGLNFPVQVWDKLKHAGAFFVLSTLMLPAFPRLSLTKRCVFALAFGALIELVQYFLPYRQANGLDLLANAVGMVAFESFYAIGKKLFFKNPPSTH